MPLFFSKVAQKSKTCLRLLVLQKVTGSLRLLKTSPSTIGTGLAVVGGGGGGAGGL